MTDNDDDRMPGTHRTVAAALLAYGVRGEHHHRLMSLLKRPEPREPAPEGERQPDKTGDE